MRSGWPSGDLPHVVGDPDVAIAEIATSDGDDRVRNLIGSDNWPVGALAVVPPCGLLLLGQTNDLDPILIRGLARVAVTAVDVGVGVAAGEFDVANIRGWGLIRLLVWIVAAGQDGDGADGEAEQVDDQAMGELFVG